MDEKTFEYALDLQERSKGKHICCFCENAPNGNKILDTAVNSSYSCYFDFDGVEGFDTVDNGGGFWVTHCPDYKPCFKDFYGLYINSDRFKKKRRNRIEIDGHRCKICGSPINLQVHHITYERIGFEDMDDLVTVCKKCHKGLHNLDDLG